MAAAVLSPGRDGNWQRKERTDETFQAQEQVGPCSGHHRGGYRQRRPAPPDQGDSRRYRRSSCRDGRKRRSLFHPAPGRIMKLVTVAVFGLGYVLGSRAGRERYEQIRELAHTAFKNFEASGMLQRLETYRARLEAQSGAGRSKT